MKRAHRILPKTTCDATCLQQRSLPSPSKLPVSPMSGLEVVGLIAAIVGAYSGTATFLITRKKRKEDKARRAIEEREKLNNAVALAPRQIQNEYDQDFARIGQRFAVGDEITRGQLSAILITMQCDMIQRLQKMLLSDGPNQTVDYASLLGISEVSRQNSITALAQQYQRLSVAAPVAASIPAPSLSTPRPRRPKRTPSHIADIFRIAKGLAKPEPLSAWEILVPEPGSNGARNLPVWQCSQCGLRTFFSGPRAHWTDTRDCYKKSWCPSPEQEMWIRTKQSFIDDNLMPIRNCKCPSTGLSIGYVTVTKDVFVAFEIRLIASEMLFRCNGLVKHKGLKRADCGDPRLHPPHVCNQYFMREAW